MVCAGVGIKVPLHRRKAVNQSAKIILVAVLVTVAASAETGRVAVGPIYDYIHHEFAGKLEQLVEVSISSLERSAIRCLPKPAEVRLT